MEDSKTTTTTEGDQPPAGPRPQLDNLCGYKPEGSPYPNNNPKNLKRKRDSLVCSLCDKEFDKPETYRRHVYYCSLPDNPPISNLNLPTDCIFAEHGDLLLEVVDFAETEGEESQEPARLVVDSKILMGSSSFFASLLNEKSPFRENEIVIRPGYPGKLKLEDWVDGLKFVLQFIHHKNRDGMKPKNVDEFYEIALVVDKYDFKEVQDYAINWRDLGPGNGFNTGFWSEVECEIKAWHREVIDPRWLVIGWVFGFDKEFQEAARWIVLNSVYDEERLTTKEIGISPWGSFLESFTPADKPLPYGIPPIVYEQILETYEKHREAVCDKIESIYDRIHTLRPYPTASYGKGHCDIFRHENEFYCSTLANLPEEFLFEYFKVERTYTTNSIITIVNHTLYNYSRDHFKKLDSGGKVYHRSPSASDIANVRKLGLGMGRLTFACPSITSLLKEFEEFDEKVIQPFYGSKPSELKKLSLWDFPSRRERFSKRYHEVITNSEKKASKRTDKSRNWAEWLKSMHGDI